MSGGPPRRAPERSASPSPGSRLQPRRLALVLGIGAVLAGGILGGASALDSPVGEGARDAAQAEAPVEEAPAGPSTANLPPFAMVLDRRLPPGVANLPPPQQAERLRARAMATGSPARLVELGSVLQLLGDLTSAEFAYRQALERAPGDLSAQVGLAVLDGSVGGEGLVVSAERLRELAEAHPDSQLVSFNLGWVELYRGRVAAAQEAFSRTVALGADTRLGRTARALIAASEEVRITPGP